MQVLPTVPSPTTTHFIGLPDDICDAKQRKERQKQKERMKLATFALFAYYKMSECAILPSNKTKSIATRFYDNKLFMSFAKPNCKHSS